MTKIFPHCTISVGLAPLADYNTQTKAHNWYIHSSAAILESLKFTKAIKFNSEECCYDTPFSPELLSKCKKLLCCP